jgi:hypothetical protein
MLLRWAQDAMIYTPSFIMTGSGIQKLMGEGGFTDTHTEQRLQEDEMCETNNK